MSRPTGISVLGALYILAGIAWLTMAIFVGALSSSYMGNSMLNGIAAFGGVIAGIAVIVAFIEFAIAGALLSGSNWGRTIVIILVIIDLILQVISLFGMNVFAIGFVILDLIVLYYMWRPHVIDYFKGTNYSGRQKPMFYCKYCKYPAVRYDDIQHHMLTCSKKPNAEKEDNIKNIGILKTRLAKGEITKEEYDDLKKEFE
jgi:hypothetical protein